MTDIHPREILITTIARLLDGVRHVAVGASSPVTFGSTPNRFANSPTSHRVETVSGPVTFSTSGGELATVNARRAMLLASPCQITLTLPIVTSTACPAWTWEAMS